MNFANLLAGIALESAYRLTCATCNKRSGHLTRRQWFRLGQAIVAAHPEYLPG